MAVATEASRRSWAKGNAAQEWWAAWHQAKFGRSLEGTPVPNFKEWDYKDSANGCTYEVKYDERASDTGNICFELHGEGRGATGLMGSTATWLVFLVPESAEQVRVIYLKRVIALQTFFNALETGIPLGKFVKVAWAGDCIAHCWLVPEYLVHELMNTNTFTGEVEK